MFNKKIEKRWIEKIHGYGIFTLEDIQENELVLIDQGIILSTQEYLALSPELKNLCYQIDIDKVLAPKDFENIDDIFFINHSCSPNTRYNKGKWFASHIIQAGEEITHDYALLWSNNIEHFEINPCSCGSEKCRGKMTGDDWKIPEPQERYKGQFLPYVLEKIF